MDRQEHRIERRLAAIFAADVAGSSRLMNRDEAGSPTPQATVSRPSALDAVQVALRVADVARRARAERCAA
ncbi:MULTISPECIES: hypothetical protein [Microvirga]|uniref:hypothetical protein n=1 Tax=Microvirga TaxID=186650 RepID=UPI0021C7A45D|nr:MULTISPECIES: hypothetical protein [unclassified Microvirga]